MATTDVANALPLSDSEVARIRTDFPILSRTVNGHPLTYLDSAATSHKPRAVLDAIRHYYEHSNANVHRGVHTLGNESTDVFENARTRVAAFIDAPVEGIVMVRNTTEALNLVAAAYARERLQPGDRVVLSEMEHHSNLVPWQLAADRAGLELAFIRLADDGSLDLGHADELLRGPTKLVSISQQSNVLGTVNDVAAIVALAHAQGVLVCVDAAQSVPHVPVSVAELDCDFMAFSGHKMCGPMGAGVLWARPELLELMPPFLGGGMMIERVDLLSSTWNSIPHKFEAGTPDVASAAGLAAACDYLDSIGRARIHAHEARLATRLCEALDALGGITRYGPRDRGGHGGVVSFNVDGIHAHDVGTILDRLGIAVRAGHHCCQPLMHRLGAAATARASLYVYSTDDEVDALIAGLIEVRRVFAA